MKTSSWNFFERGADYWKMIHVKIDVCKNAKKLHLAFDEDEHFFDKVISLMKQYSIFL